MNIIIIEDEELAAKRLESMIKSYDSEINVVAKLESVEDAVNWFNENPQPDLIFLDIHLEDDLSFSIFEKVKVVSPIIFTTAFDEYAIKAFKLKSIDYLLKPINQDELHNAIDKYKQWNNKDNAKVDLSSLYEMITKKEPEYKNRFSVTVGQKIKTVDISEVAYFYSEDSITFLTTKDNHNYTVDYSLDQLTDMVNPIDFFRINRQFLVKLKAIGQIHVFPKSKLKIELLPTIDKEIFVSVEKVTKFKNWLDA